HLSDIYLSTYSWRSDSELHRNAGRVLYPWYVDRARASSFCDSDMKTDFLKLMRNEKRPTMPPFQRPLYSDGGWAILGRVLERLTNLPLNDALQKALSKPLDLNYTAYMKPPRNDTNAIVLPGSLDESSWGYDNQV